jgi:hypothetical protein
VNEIWNRVPSNLDVSIGRYRASVAFEFPAMLDVYRHHAVVTEHFDLDGAWDECFVAVRREPSDWPQLVVTQRFAPAGPGFDPGVLIVPETETIFIGAGERLLAYAGRGESWSRLLIDAANGGFWGWRQHDDCVAMSAELGLAVWTTSGEKLWSTYVEPPWTYSVERGRMKLNVMGTITEFPLSNGPGGPETQNSLSV